MIQKNSLFARCRFVLCKALEDSGWLSPKEVIIGRWEKTNETPFWKDEKGVFYDIHNRLLSFPNEKTRQYYITYYLREGVLPGNRDTWYVLPGEDWSKKVSKEPSVYIDNNLVEYNKNYFPTKFKNPHNARWYHEYARLHGAFPYTTITEI
jgi:hypothetical protein